MNTRQMAWLLAKDLLLRNKLRTFLLAFYAGIIVIMHYMLVLGQYNTLIPIGAPLLVMIPLVMTSAYSGKYIRVFRTLPIGLESHYKWIWGLLLIVPATLFILSTAFLLIVARTVLPITLPSPVPILFGICLMLETSATCILVAELLAEAIHPLIRLIGMLVLIGSLALLTTFHTPDTVAMVALTLIPVFIPIGWLSYHWSSRLGRFYYLAGDSWAFPEEKRFRKVLRYFVRGTRLCLTVSVIALGLLGLIMYTFGTFVMIPDSDLHLLSAFLFALVIQAVGFYQIGHIRSLRVLPLSTLRLTLRITVPSVGIVLGFGSPAVLLLCLDERRYLLSRFISLSLLAAALGSVLLTLRAWRLAKPGKVHVLFLLQALLIGGLVLRGERYFGSLAVSIVAVTVILCSHAALYWIIGNSSRPYQIRPGNSLWTRR